MILGRNWGAQFGSSRVLLLARRALRRTDHSSQVCGQVEEREEWARLRPGRGAQDLDDRLQRALRLGRHGCSRLGEPLARGALITALLIKQPCSRLWECGVVLAGVKAKPCGCPTASLDPSSGRHRNGSRREQARVQEQDIPGEWWCRGAGGELGRFGVGFECNFPYFVEKTACHRTQIRIE
jgi:hypothetical protein